MHLGGLVLSLLFLAGGARRSYRIADFHQDAQQQDTSLANRAEVALQAQEALIPRGLGRGVFHRTGLQPHRAAPSSLHPWFHQAASGPDESRLPAKSPLEAMQGAMVGALAAGALAAGVVHPLAAQADTQAAAPVVLKAGATESERYLAASDAVASAKRLTDAAESQLSAAKANLFDLEIKLYTSELDKALKGLEAAQNYLKAADKLEADYAEKSVKAVADADKSSAKIVKAAKDTQEKSEKVLKDVEKPKKSEETKK